MFVKKDAAEPRRTPRNFIPCAFAFTWMIAAPVAGHAQGSVDVIAGFERTGLYPTSVLIQANDGSFYGITYGGGVFDNGSIFKLDVSARSRPSTHSTLSMEPSRLAD
jgi:uncharacterized repeat protein (TIGR03803 family)